ncbi:MAG: DUF192 domain-containing protein [Bryobacteraceae bacterium]
MRYWLLVMVLCLLGAGCGAKDAGKDTGAAGVALDTVKLPDGQEIRAEVEIDPADMQKGMMFRDALPRGRGMLFIHQSPSAYKYWMFQVKIPLDMIWMDSTRHIVEISPDTPPCKTKASLCPEYGGNATAQYVLELGGGEAKRLGLNLGQTLEF